MYVCTYICMNVCIKIREYMYENMYTCIQQECTKDKSINKKLGII